MIHLCKGIISRCFFFIFIFSNFHFWVVSGVKKQKMALNDKKFCLSHSKSQEAYTIWSWFLMNICKILTSPGPFFYFFKILIFWIILGVYKGKEWPKMKKHSVYLKWNLRNCTLYVHDFWYTFEMMTFPGTVFIFPNFWFSGSLGRMREGGTRAKNDPKWQKIMSRPYIKSQELYAHMAVTFGNYFSFFQNSDFLGF